MRMYDIIDHKKNGETLSKAEIAFWIDGCTSGHIPDYQSAALLMAIYLNGMIPRETADLTQQMAASGEMLDLSAISGIKVDKHSTGGVGDKTTLIVGPLAAACGVPIAKMSGRGLGFTGGTADKLESIPGYQTTIPQEQFIRQVNEIGISLITSSAMLAPADQKLYALRDVTATVESIPLIAASIMSKKLASGCDRIALDVKVGSGAFMKTISDAEALAEQMVSIGKHAGRKTVALLTDMSEPLGYTVGNALEVQEAIEVLCGTGESRLTELCLALTADILFLAEKGSLSECEQAAEKALRSGAGLEKLSELVTAQNGDARYIRDSSLFAPAAHTAVLTAPQDGCLDSIDAKCCGIASMMLGAGRETKEDALDFSAGIRFHKKSGYAVKIGEPVATLYSSTEEKLAPALEMLTSALCFSKSPVQLRPTILKRIES